MKKLTAEKCREQFEKWLDKNSYNRKRDQMGLYEASFCQSAWIGWQASWQALEQQDVDSEALAVSREIMKIMYSSMPKGGSSQLMAQVQCLVIDAMKVAQGDKSLSRQQQRERGEEA